MLHQTVDREKDREKDMEYVEKCVDGE